MADYDLSGLSPRSFEQLIQAIAARVIGPGIVIFGDGPDGGREATFEGSIPYPDRDSGWQGYGIVQAKFRQRPLGSKQDGEWALQQLRSELEKFVDPERNLRKPEYYIFATNVVLTPVQDKGSKDKVYALIQAFKGKLPLLKLTMFGTMTRSVGFLTTVRIYGEDTQPGSPLETFLPKSSNGLSHINRTLTRS